MANNRMKKLGFDRNMNRKLESLCSFSDCLIKNGNFDFTLRYIWQKWNIPGSDILVVLSNSTSYKH